MTEWKREYKRAFPTCALVFVGFVLGIMGLVFLLLFPAIGVPLLLGAIGIPFLIRYLFANYVITCGPEGFPSRPRASVPDASITSIVGTK